MAVLEKIVSAPLKALGILHTPKSEPTALPQASRDDAAADIAADDELQRRKGGAADIITGATGAGTPLTGGKLILGS